MKKILTSLMAIVFALLIVAPTALAAETSFLHKTPKKTCVVIVGSSDVKTPEFFKNVDKTFKSESTDKKIDCGANIQNLYQKYWLDKGFLEEQKITKEDLHAFVKYSGYDNVLVLMVSDPIIEKTRVPAGFFTVDHIKASIEVKSFLANDTSILKAVTVTKSDGSDESQFRAKRGAFGRCIKEIQEEINTLI